MTALTTIKNSLPNLDHPRRLLVVVALFIVLVSLVSYFSNNSLVAIRTADGTTADEYLAFTKAGNDEAEKLGSLFGRIVVPRNALSILAKSGDNETLISLTDHKLPFAFGTIEIPLEGQRQAKLVSKGGQGCPFAIGNDIYSYDCTQPAVFSKFTGSLTGLPKHSISGPEIPTFSSGYQATRYKDGIIAQNIAVGRILDYSVSYVSPGKPLITKTLPDGFYKRYDYIMMLADASNTKNNSVVVYNATSGVGYFFEDFLSSANAVEFKRQYSFTTSVKQSACTFVDTTMTCYHGVPGEGSHGYEGAATTDEDGGLIDTPTTDTGKERGAIEQVSFNSGKASTTSTQGPVSYGVDDVFVTADNTIYTRSGHDLDRVTISDKSFTTSTIAHDSEIATANSNLYYVSDNKIYTYDNASKSSSLIYRPANESVYDLKSFGGQLYMLNYADKDPAQLLLTYQLNDN